MASIGHPVFFVLVSSISVLNDPWMRTDLFYRNTLLRILLEQLGYEVTSVLGHIVRESDLIVHNHSKSIPVRLGLERSFSR